MADKRDVGPDGQTYVFPDDATPAEIKDYYKRKGIAAPPMVGSPRFGANGTPEFTSGTTDTPPPDPATQGTASYINDLLHQYGDAAFRGAAQPQGLGDVMGLLTAPTDATRGIAGPILTRGAQAIKAAVGKTNGIRGVVTAPVRAVNEFADALPSANARAINAFKGGPEIPATPAPIRVNSPRPPDPFENAAAAAAKERTGASASTVSPAERAGLKKAGYSDEVIERIAQADGAKKPAPPSYDEIAQARQAAEKAVKAGKAGDTPAPAASPEVPPQGNVAPLGGAVAQGGVKPPPPTLDPLAQAVRDQTGIPEAWKGFTKSPPATPLPGEAPSLAPAAAKIGNKGWDRIVSESEAANKLADVHLENNDPEKAARVIEDALNRFFGKSGPIAKSAGGAAVGGSAMETALAEIRRLIERRNKKKDGA